MFCLTLIFTLFVIAANGAERTSLCSNNTEKQKIDLKQLNGTWFIYSATHVIQELEGTKCPSIDFKLNTNNETELYFHYNKTYTHGNASAQLLQNDTVLQITLQGEKDKKIDFNLVKVEYKNYAVLFACRNNTQNGSTYEVLNLVRELHPSETSVRVFNDTNKMLNLADVKLEIYNHTEESSHGHDTIPNVKLETNNGTQATNSTQEEIKKNSADGLVCSTLATSIAIAMLSRFFY